MRPLLPPAETRTAGTECTLRHLGALSFPATLDTLTLLMWIMTGSSHLLGYGCINSVLVPVSSSSAYNRIVPFGRSTRTSPLNKQYSDSVSLVHLNTSFFSRSPICRSRSMERPSHLEPDECERPSFLRSFSGQLAVDSEYRVSRLYDIEARTRVQKKRVERRTAFGLFLSLFSCSHERWEEVLAGAADKARPSKGCEAALEVIGSLAA
jgi:hypothetical protein